METTNVSKNFSTNKYGDEALAVFAQHVIASLTGNKTFPTPDPTLAVVNTAQTVFSAAVAKAVDGTKQDTADKNAKREALVVLLQQLADYVQRISKGEDVSILSSGFDIHKRHEPVGPLPVPNNFKVQVGANKGSIQVSCDAVTNANFYEFEYTESPASVVSAWIKKTCTKKQLLIEDLESGKEYSFRVAAAGSNPSRHWSAEVSSFVL